MSADAEHRAHTPGGKKEISSEKGRREIGLGIGAGDMRQFVNVQQGYIPEPGGEEVKSRSWPSKLTVTRVTATAMKTPKEIRDLLALACRLLPKGDRTRGRHA